ncbi:MAG: response regulator [Promethearchaeota archaeon]
MTNSNNLNDIEHSKINENSKINTSKKLKKTLEMIQYEKETGKYAIWKGEITNDFKKWLKGKKKPENEKERISLYVTRDMKRKWTEFARECGYSTISKFIREAVNHFIDEKSRTIRGAKFKLDKEAMKSISHTLKEPLTSIKGYSQFLLETEDKILNEDIRNAIQNIFDSSIMLENKIVNILDKISTESEGTDILLIEDDLSTIRLLTSYFESKGFSCKGVISGTKAIEELKISHPKVILLDIILPDLSGYDLSKMIKMDRELKDIPVYLLTAIPRSEVEKNIKESMADGLILKPFDFADFEMILNYLSEKKKLSKESERNNQQDE